MDEKQDIMERPFSYQVVRVTLGIIFPSLIAIFGIVFFLIALPSFQKGELSIL